jgi:hypothetical protein
LQFRGHELIGDSNSVSINNGHICAIPYPVGSPDEFYLITPAQIFTFRQLIVIDGTARIDYTAIFLLAKTVIGAGNSVGSNVI